MRGGWIVLALVVLQRLAELAYASRNTAALRQAGGVEVGRRHYPAMVALHAAWLATIAAGVWQDPRIRPVPLLLFAGLQPLRLWAIAALGRYWTTRVMTVAGEPLVRSGPYRFIRHPNYAVVIGEIALLPLVFGQITTALAFSVANAVLLAWRIRTENRVLALRGAAQG